MYRGNTQQVREKLEQGNSLYMKAVDFSEKPIRLRVIPWIIKGQKVDFLSFFEGWHDVATKNDKGKTEVKSRPIRFYNVEDIPNDLQWSVGKAFAGEKPKPQIPKSTIAFIGYRYDEQQPKIVTIPNVAFVKQMLNFAEEKNEDGTDNEAYIEDMSKFDIVIKKDDKNFTINVQKPKIGNGEDIPSEILKALKDFEWSWEAFMDCVKIDDAEQKFTIDDVVDVLTSSGSNQKPAQKAQNKKEEKEVASTKVDDNFQRVENWAEITTPKGVKLGSLGLEKLKEYKEFLISKNLNKPDNRAYLAILTGIEELSTPASDPVEDEDNGGW